MSQVLGVLFIFFFIVGCSSLGSGHYVLMKPGENLKSLSKEFKVPAWQIKQANRTRKVASGQWVYIPLKRGILSQTQNISSEYYFQHGRLAWPVPSSKRLSSKFGRRWGKAHEGIDIAARSGTAIVAAESGVVVYSGADLGGYGNLTVISHNGGLFSIYAHAKKNFTSKGDKVHRGQVIAQVGSSGKATGPHLHFEVRFDSKAMDPLKFVAYKD
jgi:murein DD-endopeptidase MepM/ murein hydrolase activator NlpD